MADLQYFHRFPELPFEIRQMIWMFSFPRARSVRVRLAALNWFYHNGKSPEVRDVKFSHEESDPIVALWTCRESRQAVLSVYRHRVARGKTIYFCPDRDTILFAGFEPIFETLVSQGSRPAFIARLLVNLCERGASQFADSSTNVEWREPVLERLGYITREPSLSGQAPDQEKPNRYTTRIYPI